MVPARKRAWSMLCCSGRIMDASLQGKILASRVYPEFFPVSPGETVLHAGCGEGAQMLAYGFVSSKKGDTGRVVCVDVQELRVNTTLRHAREAGISDIEARMADLEALPFQDAVFDRIVAVDIIQHVLNPQRVFAEFRRVLKPGGELLITFPALQHYLLTKISRWKNKKGHPSSSWHPDAFNHNLPLSRWLTMGRASGLTFVRSHATTLMPPMHRYGIKRFWFSNDVIHRIDWFFGGLPGFKRLGQALMVVYQKQLTAYR